MSTIQENYLTREIVTLDQEKLESLSETRVQVEIKQITNVPHRKQIRKLKLYQEIESSPKELPLYMLP